MMDTPDRNGEIVRGIDPERSLDLFKRRYGEVSPPVQEAYTIEYNRYCVEHNLSYYKDDPIWNEGNFRYPGHVLSNTCEMLAAEALLRRFPGSSIRVARSKADQVDGVDIYVDHPSFSMTLYVSVKASRSRDDRGCTITPEMAQQIAASDKSTLMAFVEPEWDSGAVLLVSTDEFRRLYKLDRFKKSGSRGLLIDMTEFSDDLPTELLATRIIL